VAQVRSTSSRSSGLAAAFATQLVLSSSPGDGNIPGRRWSSRDVSSARKGPRVSAVFVASFRTRAEAEGQGRVKCDPSLAARRGRYALRCRRRRLSRASRPGRRSMRRKVHGPGASASWSGSAMARAEAVRRSGALDDVFRLPGSPGSRGMAAERAARKRRRCGDTSAAGPTVHLDASEARWMQGARKRARRRTYGASHTRATKRRSRRSLQRRRAPRRSGWRHLGRTRGALRGAGPKGTVRRRDRAKRDDVADRASGTRSRRARYTTPATWLGPDSSGHGEVRPSDPRWLPRRASEEADARESTVDLHDEQLRCRTRPRRHAFTEETGRATSRVDAGVRARQRTLNGGCGG